MNMMENISDYCEKPLTLNSNANTKGGDKMKRITKHAFIMPLLILALSLFIGFGASDALGVDFGLYTINFLGATYDPGSDATTFTYQVMAAVNYGFDDWTIELNPDCFGSGDVLEASEPYIYVGPDPMTGIYGIKFTTPYAAGETRTVWFRLPGNLSITAVKVDLRYTCTHWTKEIEGPECGGQPGPPPPEGEGMSPGYWGNQLAIYLGYKNGKLKEPNVESYAAQYGYTAEEAYAIMLSGKGGTPVEKLHRQLLAAKLSTAAGYLLNMAELLEWGQYMVAHPAEFTFQELEDAKDLFESLHD